MNRIAKSFLSAAAAGTLLVAAAFTAQAQQNCAPRAHALGKLKQEYREQVLGRGLTPNGKAMIELFVGKSGNWTALVSHPNGRSCFIAVGESWHEIKPALPDIL